MEILKTGSDALFILLGAIMVLAMHAGFAFLELGTVRKKNQVNALVKILVDFAVSTIAYFFIGYSIAYGVNFFSGAELLAEKNGYEMVKFFFLLTFAGIPLTAGFIAKFSIFSAAFENGGMWLVLVGVMSSAIAAFFYIRVIVLMFFREPAEDSTSVIIPSIFTQITIAISAALTILIGVFPQPLLNLINNLALLVR